MNMKSTKLMSLESTKLMKSTRKYWLIGIKITADLVNYKILNKELDKFWE